MAGDLDTQIFGWINFPPLKGSVFPSKTVCPQLLRGPLLCCSHLASQISPSFWQQCTGSCGTTWSQSCALYCKNCLGDTQIDVWAVMCPVVGKLGMFPVAAMSWEPPIPKPSQPNGQLEPHAAGSWLLPQHQITHENVCVSLICFGKVC